MNASTDHRVSVVIATRDGADHLGDQLAALADQQMDARFEVLIADNGSTDATVEVAQRYTDRLDLRVVDASASPGAAFARNVGVAAASAPRILFLDDDDVVAPGYLAAMTAALDQFDFVAARVDGRALNPAWRVDMRAIDVHEGLRGSKYPWALSCALGVTRTAFDAIGGFDPDFTGSGEDVDFCWRMQNASFELHLVADAVVHRRLRTTRRGLFRQARRYALGSEQLRRKRGTPRSESLLHGLPGGLRLALTGRTRSKRALGIFLTGRTVGRVQGALRRQ